MDVDVTSYEGRHCQLFYIFIRLRGPLSTPCTEEIPTKMLYPTFVYPRVMHGIKDDMFLVSKGIDRMYMIS